MSDLGPQRQNLSYGSLLQVPGGITSALTAVTDGEGNATPLQLSSTQVSITGYVSATAQNVLGGIAGSLLYQIDTDQTGFTNIGSAGQLLRSNGNSAPTWVTINAVSVGALPAAGGTMTGNIAMSGYSVTGLGSPVSASDAATKSYVDSVAVGLQVKTPVRVATTADNSLLGLQTVDGVLLANSDRVLVKNQAISADNGVYLASSGSWLRAPDMDSWAEFVGAYVYVQSGTTNGNSGWTCSATAGGTLGISPIIWNQFSQANTYSAGAGLTLAGSTFSITAPVTVALGGTGVTTISGLVKGNGASAFTAAVAGTDYAPATSGTTILAGNGSGGFSSVSIGSGLNYGSGTLRTSTGTDATKLLASDGANGFSAVTVGSGLSYSSGTLTASGGSSSLFYNVKDYGAVGNASADDTTAIQNAINAAGAAGSGTVYFPPGNYRITSAINIPYWGITLMGAGMFSSQLYQTTSNSGMLVFNNVAGCVVEKMSFLYSSTPTGGNVIEIKNSAGYITLQDFIIRNCYTGISINSGAVAVYLDNFTINDAINSSISCDSINDVFASNFVCSCATSSSLAQGGHIRLSNKVEAFTLVNGDVIGGKYSMVCTATTYNPSLFGHPRFNYFANLYMDSSVLGVAFDACTHWDFANCWFASCASGPGFEMGRSFSTKFTNCKFFGNALAGVQVGVNSSWVTFTSCEFYGNSLAVSGGYAGCQIDNNVQNFQILGCIGTNANSASNVQAAGLFIGSGADYFIVSNNNFRPVLSGTSIINNAGTSATKIVSQNLT